MAADPQRHNPQRHNPRPDDPSGSSNDPTTDLLGRWMQHHQRRSTDRQGAAQPRLGAGEPETEPARRLPSAATPSSALREDPVIGSRIAPPSTFGMRRAPANEQRGEHPELDRPTPPGWEPIITPSVRKRAAEAEAKLAPTERRSRLRRLTGRLADQATQDPGVNDRGNDRVNDPAVDSVVDRTDAPRTGDPAVQGTVPEPLAPPTPHAPPAPPAPPTPPAQSAPPLPENETPALDVAVAPAAPPGPKHAAYPATAPVDVVESLSPSPPPPSHRAPDPVTPPKRAPAPEPAVPEPAAPEPAAPELAEPVAPAASQHEPEGLATPEPPPARPVLAADQAPLSAIHPAAPPQTHPQPPYTSATAAFLDSSSAFLAPPSREVPSPGVPSPGVPSPVAAHEPPAQRLPQHAQELPPEQAQEKAQQQAQKLAQPLQEKGHQHTEKSERARADAVAEMPGVYRFAPRRTARGLLTIGLLIGFVATAYFAIPAYQQRDMASIGLVAIATLATVMVWAIRAGESITQVEVHQGQLAVVHQGTRHVFDLASPYTRLEVHGRPGKRGWKVLFPRGDIEPFAVDATMVYPEEFMRVLRFFRPEISDR